MDTLYWIIIVFLLVLAIFDLMVGVSNDAVNFLNSAIGSRVAPMKVILFVASMGILLGSIFSSGMMEIARSGVFMPNQFHFHSVMLLFLAVMITEVILLDLYNTFGLPTSTTVSLVFALLGAAICVAFFEMSKVSEPRTLGQYIQSAKALQMITGILSSVVIAFVCGSIVMYFSRLLFSFRFHKLFRLMGAAWCGLSLTAITYFAIYKGLKGTTLLSEDALNYVDANLWLSLFIGFVGWTVIMALLQHVFRLNILKIIILAGTFTLALAFAGNDLVNFIGVFMAGLASFNIAQDVIASGGSLDNLMMSGLLGKVEAEWYFLFTAGAIMVAAIWLSKKSRTVSETEVNLAKNDEGSIERFGSVPPARAIVRSCVNFGKWMDSVTPDPVLRFIENRFRPIPHNGEDRAPFDMIRASVNLTVAALLISSATSLKLPLSTTYVTFMVAMGSSLADKAWGRESAVYRVTGVLTVISGWFMTAFLAFAASAIIACLLLWGELYAIMGLVLLTATMLVKSSILHKKRSHEQANNVVDEEVISNENILDKCSDDLGDAMQKINSIYAGTIQALFDEDRKTLHLLLNDAEDFRETIKNRRKYEVLPTIHKLQEGNIETGHYYIRVLDYLNEVSKSLLDFTRTSFAYIDNTHNGLSEEQVADLRVIDEAMHRVYSGFAHVIETKDYTRLTDILIARDQLFDLFSEVIKRQIKRTCNNQSNARNSMLYLEILNEVKNMALQSRSLIKAQRLFMQRKNPS